MSNNLFDVYHEVGVTSKDFWDQLEAKYITKDAMSKKFLVGNFMHFVMHDNRTVMDWFHEVCRMYGKFKQH
ncbi:UNVERIFIED_CONTAM: hypothetical protein ITH36_25310, partial [Salmonella enterica subsp. enterica serovar Weltevreden]